MAIDVASASASDFRPLVGESFRLSFPSGASVSAKLASVDEGAPYRPDLRAPFTLRFHVPRASSPSDSMQGVVTVEHEAIGRLDLFAVARQPHDDVAPWDVDFG